MNAKVAVIGSGLSALGAIKALLAQGICPTVLDTGELLDSGREALANALAGRAPSEWTANEVELLSQNATVHNGSSVPKKLLFGSDFFYGKSRIEAPLEYRGNLPPFSYARGGFSVGWGAAVLPPQECDLIDWPIAISEITKYCQIAVSDLPYSARNDGLSLNFPLLKDSGALHLSRAESLILNKLATASLLKKDNLVFGQARLLVNPNQGGAANGCKYCGHCMSGCVYKSIYKADDDILELSSKGKINYKGGCLVLELSEQHDQATVKYIDSSGCEQIKKFDKVFLAAGAVNTTRIVLNSLQLFNKTVTLKARGGFVLPVFSLKKLPNDWPNCNTQPGIFLEFKGKGLKNWVHVQISAANELLYQKLGSGLFGGIKKSLMEHIVLFFVNFHSDHGGHYELWLTPKAGETDQACLHSRQCRNKMHWVQFFLSSLKIFKVCLKIGCIPLIPFAKNNIGSYHVGGTFPMKAQLSGDNLNTDELGRVAAWQHIHIVDTSIFPSLPGTTIGLLAMANARRIIEKIRW